MKLSQIVNNVGIDLILRVVVGEQDKPATQHIGLRTQFLVTMHYQSKSVSIDVIPKGLNQWPAIHRKHEPHFNMLLPWSKPDHRITLLG